VGTSDAGSPPDAAAHDSSASSREACEAGRAALTAGRWEEAAGCFTRALAAEESAAAYDGLAWAAWWRDDEATVFDARERAYHLYRDGGDARGAARTATWLALDALDFHGAPSVAYGWVRRARRLLVPLDPGPDHGWLAFLDGFLAHMGGDTTTTVDRATYAADLGRRLGVPDLEMLGLALEGAARVACADVADGLRCLDEAGATALEGGARIPISGAWACCFLVSSCTAVHDYPRAADWCDRLATFAERYGSRYMLAFCRAEYGAVHLWRGRWAEAESLLAASVEDFRQSRPAWVGAPQVGLAELRRRQGRADEAVALLEPLGGAAEAQVVRARLALDAGDARRAVELAQRVLRRVPEHRVLDRAPALDVLTAALVARGRLDEADEVLASLRDVYARAGTVPLAARTDLAAGVLTAARGDHTRARPLLEDAADGFARTGSAYDAARARVELATTFVALGRVDEARREATAACETLGGLGAVREEGRARQVLDLTGAAPDPEGTGGTSGPAAERGPDGGPAASPPGVRLTPRECEVLGLLAEGLTNQRIAERLVVSEHTVHRHVTHILRKLGLPSRTAAAAHAVRSGLTGRP
jgi:LuxR family transcriptional regulator, maltose regulon positive regulatory protein